MTYAARAPTRLSVAMNIAKLPEAVKRAPPIGHGGAENRFEREAPSHAIERSPNHRGKSDGDG